MTAGARGAVIFKFESEEAIDALRHRLQALHLGAALEHMPTPYAHEGRGVVGDGSKVGKGLLQVLVLALEARDGGRAPCFHTAVARRGTPRGPVAAAGACSSAGAAIAPPPPAA